MKKINRSALIKRAEKLSEITAEDDLEKEIIEHIKAIHDRTLRRKLILDYRQKFNPTQYQGELKSISDKLDNLENKLKHMSKRKKDIKENRKITRALHEKE